MAIEGASRNPSLHLMLLDLLRVLATPAPRDHRRLGCVGDSIRTGSRARRCAAAWAPHLAATRSVIRAAIDGTETRGTAVVLGSGHLDDVPLDDLAGAFARVVLVDAVHPLPARRAARVRGNVTLLTADLSGSFALLLGRSDGLGAMLPAICAAPETGLVVSVNLLSQLPIRPVERLEASRRPLGSYAPEDGDALGRAIVAGHLAALGALSARICLVTDTEEIEEDRDGRVQERLDLLYGVGLPVPARRWVWELAPFGEGPPGRRLLHPVSGYPDFRPG